MDAERREALLDSLRAGVDLARACRAAGLLGTDVRGAAADDDDLRAALRDADFRAALQRPGAVPAPAEPRPPPDLFAEALNLLRSGLTLAASAHRVGLRVPNLRARAASDGNFARRLAEAMAASKGSAPRIRAKGPPPPSESAPEPGHGAPSPPIADEAAPIGPRPYPRDEERWRIARAEAAALGVGLFGTLLWLNAKASAIGIPPISAWWRYTFAEFYASCARWLVARVGRGGGKSTTLCQMAANEALFAERVIPPGQVWIWPFISVAPADAERRVGELQSIFASIEVEAEKKSPHGLATLRLLDAARQPVMFVSLASTIAGVSGPTTIGGTIDEEAKLRDQRGNVNQASEILASLVQTFRARPGIHGIRCSSAWTTSGSHAESVAEGSTEVNHVARIGEPFVGDVLRGLATVAAWEQKRGDRAAADMIRAYAATVTADSPNIPTWVANPTISALASRVEIEAQPSAGLGGVPRVAYWLRENVSVPMDPGVGGGTKVDQFTGLAEMNEALCAAHRGDVIWNPPPMDYAGRW